MKDYKIGSHKVRGVSNHLVGITSIDFRCCSESEYSINPVLPRAMDERAAFPMRRSAADGERDVQSER